jgi:DNA-binding transcriptional LysR family regulator
MLMELRQLEYLLAVVEDANFTRAAERLHVSQSGVSAQIRQLERELGQTLLDRTERTVRLTTAGEAIAPYARAALAAVKATRQTAGELAGLLRGRVAVGMVTGCSVAALFDGLQEFHQRYPGIEIVLEEDASDRLVEGVRTGRFDLALLGTATPLPAQLQSEMVADEAVVAAVPFGHPLANEDEVLLSRLVQFPLICLPKGSGVRAALDTGCTAGGLLANITLEASAPDVVTGLAERGLGVAVVSETMASAHRSTLAAVTITDPAMSSRLELAWRAGDSGSTAAAALVRHARAGFAVG